MKSLKRAAQREASTACTPRDGLVVREVVEAAAVEQDFQAKVWLSNVESVGGAAQAELSARTAGRAQPGQVIRAVSLHALKSRLIALLTSRVPAEQVLAELTEWFQANPVSVRPGRPVRRREFSPSRSYHYPRRVRKLVFKPCHPYLNGSGDGVRGAVHGARSCDSESRSVSHLVRPHWAAGLPLIWRSPGCEVIVGVVAP